MLLALTKPAEPEAVSRETGLPLFKVRSGLRELAQAGLVEERSGEYIITNTGRKMSQETA